MLEPLITNVIFKIKSALCDETPCKKYVNHMMQLEGLANKIAKLQILASKPKLASNYFKKILVWILRFDFQHSNLIIRTTYQARGDRSFEKVGG